MNKNPAWLWKLFPLKYGEALPPLSNKEEKTNNNVLKKTFKLLYKRAKNYKSKKISKTGFLEFINSFEEEIINQQVKMQNNFQIPFIRSFLNYIRINGKEHSQFSTSYKGHTRKIQLKKLLKSIFNNRLPDITYTIKIPNALLVRSQKNAFKLVIVEITNNPDLSIYDSVIEQIIDDLNSKLLDIAVILPNGLIKTLETIKKPLKSDTNTVGSVIQPNSSLSSQNNKPLLPSPPKRKKRKIVGHTLSSSKPDLFEIAINKEYENQIDLSGKWCVAKFYNCKVLGYLLDPWTENDQSSAYTHSGQMNIDSITRGINDPIPEIQFMDIKRSKFKPVASKPHLRNAPPSYTEIIEATPADFDFFFTSENPVRFCKLIGSNWMPAFDYKILVTHHFMILAATRMGKGYFANSLALNIVGKPIVSSKGKEKPLGILYIDTPGQWVTDTYGFFKDLSPSEDPREIISASDLGVTNTFEQVELIWRIYYLNHLHIPKDKVRKIQGHLETQRKMFRWYSDFLDCLENAIQDAYATNSERILEKFRNYMDSMGGENLWNNIVRKAILCGPKTMKRLEDGLKNGKLVILDLGDIKPRYKAGFVYRILKSIQKDAEKTYNDLGRDEYCYGALVLIDEVQNFVPEIGKGHGYAYESRCRDLIISIATEGGKYGLGLGLLSQRIAWTAKDVIHNIHTYFIGRVLSIDAERAKKILGGNVDPTKIQKYNFFATGLACPMKKLEVRALSPKELMEEWRKRNGD